MTLLQKLIHEDVNPKWIRKTMKAIRARKHNVKTLVGACRYRLHYLRKRGIY